MGEKYIFRINSTRNSVRKIMLSAPLNSFLNNLYNLITSSHLIKEKINAVYLSINQEPVYPFIFINLNKASNSGNHLKYSYSIDFDISIFFRQKDFLNSVNIEEYITQLIQTQNFATDHYKIIGIKKQEINLIKSKDTLTSKLNINYLSSIRQK